jgi:hypothetical protein
MQSGLEGYIPTTLARLLLAFALTEENQKYAP